MRRREGEGYGAKWSGQCHFRHCDQRRQIFIILSCLFLQHGLYFLLQRPTHLQNDKNNHLTVHHFTASEEVYNGQTLLVPAHLSRVVISSARWEQNHACSHSSPSMADFHKVSVPNLSIIHCLTGGRTACRALSVPEGETTNLTCFFSEDVSKSMKGFTVLHLNGKERPSMCLLSSRIDSHRFITHTLYYNGL